MRIAIIAWGSLLWKKSKFFPKPFKRTGADTTPLTLPLEFMRISKATSSSPYLSLVISQSYGQENVVYYTITKTTVQDCIIELTKHEYHTKKIKKDKPITTISYINLKNKNEHYHAYHKDIAYKIKRWAKINKVDAIVWVDLPSNFAAITDQRFSPKRAYTWYKCHMNPTMQQYICSAYKKGIITPFSRKYVRYTNGRCTIS